LFDELLRQASLAQGEGDWAGAARMFEYLATHYQNELWMKTMAARAHFQAGNHGSVERLSREVNQVRPTIDTLLLEAKVRRKQRDCVGAIRLLAQAERWLAGEVDPALLTARISGQLKHTV
jgi:uncharacterized protein HemY